MKNQVIPNQEAGGSFKKELILLRPQLETYAYSLTLNKVDATDLVQETLLKALTYYDKFDPTTSIKAWTFTIMKNIFLNTYRRSRKHISIIEEQKDRASHDDSIKYESHEPEQDIFLDEISRQIAQIDDAQRIPFEMMANGYKYQEIADALHLSIGTVKSRIFFCRQKLMANLQEFQKNQ